VQRSRSGTVPARQGIARLKPDKTLDAYSFGGHRLLGHDVTVTLN
jgi:hypothetical protein